MNMYIPCIFINYKLAAFSPITSSIFAHRPYDRTLFSRFCRASKDHLSVHDHSLPRDRSTIVSSLAEIYALMKLGDACPPGDVFQRKQRARERERERERERDHPVRARGRLSPASRDVAAARNALKSGCRSQRIAFTSCCTQANLRRGRHQDWQKFQRCSPQDPRSGRSVVRYTSRGPSR